ncbi:DEAD/DEAH box helicase [Alsobacter sp. SYSU M60028]|uniref:Transcription-repair-coupling factor n=1 Tax=Alsobacter ponti TaxID=2962936 RepID=A0ABT1LIW3_9HYPH|nr:DEAD/DEAH box helicase [Alsobacter ponti]MCP8940655.1 DEAD/DEAH box helicase [Alsobacter ponti]
MTSRTLRAAPPVPRAGPSAPAGSEGAAALVALAAARERGAAVFVARDEPRAAAVAEIAAALDPDVDVHALPAWDCLPYDRVPPSAGIMGRRLAALAGLARTGGPRLAVTTAEALAQRLPDPAALRDAALTLARGPFDAEALDRALASRGYWRDDRVDEPGEVAWRGEVIDLFPSDRASPVRLEIDDGRIAGLRVYDAATQRGVGELGDIAVWPASEAWRPGQESLPGPFAAPGPLASPFDLLAGFAAVADPGARERIEAFLALAAEAWETRRRFGPREAQGLAEPSALYLTLDAWRDGFAALSPVELAEAEENDAPRFSAAPDPAAALHEFAAAERKAGRRVVLAAPDEAGLRRLARAAGLGAPARASSWRDVAKLPKGAAASLVLPSTSGFRAPEGDAVVVTAADLHGADAGAPAGRAADAFLGDEAFRPGDVVVHRDHGLCVLEGLETVEAGEAGATETIRLRFAGDEALMLPVAQAGALWRYGSAEADVALDALNARAWLRRRGEVEAELAETARRLAELARRRATETAAPLAAPADRLARFAARFPWRETRDQARAIADALRDLAGNRRTERLVCGDVGFGKTEVALRAAAACVFAGRQVAIAAPTTVLARQHVETFRRRFAGFGVEVRELSRFVAAAEARAVKAGLRDGSVRIVIGTHALAGKGVAFRELGLVVIDEEQRFGEAHKAKIRALGQDAHVLALTATPIPRTLQASLAGLIDLSVIATPPAPRRPVRTALLPYAPSVVREELLRERRRGGQSFVVCPRVEDMAPWTRRLAEIAPELEILTAHGGMKPTDIDDAMLRFADGRGDVLLATNIVESGLDVPNANTMIVWRPDRFGLAQLHQLRGRVGRGRARGSCLLLTDPDRRLAAPTRRRLETLAALDRPGAGFAISARDLDQRGAGDLLGADQSGHLRLVGAGLAQHLLERALAAARGETPPEEWTPEIELGCAAAIPPEYIPEPEPRLNLYRRIALAGSAREVAGLAEEIEDRFGDRPKALDRLLVLARLAVECRALGVARLDGGPQGLAASFRPGSEPAAPPHLDPPCAWREGRLVWPTPTRTPAERLRAAAAFLRACAGAG